MTEIKDTKLIRDALGSPVPQRWDEASQMYIARTVDGRIVDVDFSKVKLLRDKLGSVIPQLWDAETARFVPSNGNVNGDITIGAVTGLQPKLDTHTQQLADTANVVGGDISQIWFPPVQPKSDDILWAGSTNLNEYMALWEGLRSQFSSYIKRELLGKDSSNTHDIWKYIFAPPNYEKTVIISANVHGSEKEGQKILYRFFHHVCHDNNKYSQLSYARNKIRFIVIPIVNPWGLVANTRWNANGVDINRNFNYNWNAFVSGGVGSNDYKGTSPLSEKESKYLDAVMNQYANEGAIACIDIHATAERTTNVNTAHYYAETSRYGIGAKNIINQIIHAVAPKGFAIEKSVLGTINPSVYNQADNVYGLHSVTPEWEPGAIHGVERYSSEEMTHAVRFIGNIILQFAALNPRKYELPDPWIIEHSVNSINWKTNITAGTYEEIQNIGHVFAPNVDGILHITGELQFTNTNTAANNYFLVRIEQSGNPLLTNSSPIVNQTAGMELVTQTDGRANIVTSTRMVPIYAKDDFKGDVAIKLMVKTDVGQMLTRRVRLHAMFIPTKGNPNYTSRGSENESPQTKHYPPSVNIDY